MLHGEIKVNHHVIGEWKAVRQGPADKAGYNTYECIYTYIDNAGYKYIARWEQEHKYGNGAAALAATVIREGFVRMRPVPISEDESTEIFVSNLIN